MKLHHGGWYGRIVMLFTAILVPSTTSSSTHSSILYNSTYADLGTAPCTRLLHATGVIGCQAPANGVTGVLVKLDTVQEVDKFVNDAPKQSHAIILPLSIVSKDMLRKLEGSGKMSGVIVLMPDTPTVAPSPDPTCPNCQYGLYAGKTPQYIWNPKGTTLMASAFNFPIFAVASDVDRSTKTSTTKALLKAAADNAKTGLTAYPLNSVEFSAFMWAAIDSATCLRRNWCQPVGGLSVYSSPSGNELKRDDAKGVIMLTASLNTRAFFHDLAIGVNSGLTGLVALLAIAEAMSRTNTPSNSWTNHIVYAGFAGEDWGMAGSSRFVQDIVNDVNFKCEKEFKADSITAGCPYTKAACAFPCRRDLDYRRISMDKIKHVVELSSVGNAATAFAHVHDPSQTDTTTLASALGATVVSDVSKGKRLPSGSSAQAFVAKRATGMGAVVLADYRDTNYNGDTDDQYTNTTVQNVCKIADTTAKSVYGLATGNGTARGSVPSVNCAVVEELMTCLVKNFSCPLVTRYLQADPNAPQTGNGPDRISHYSIFQFGQAHPISQFVYRYLFDMTATGRGKVCKSSTECDAGEACLFGKCASGMTRFHDAYGTGIQLQSTGLFKVVDPALPAWTESTWDAIGFRMFKSASTGSDVVQLMVGLVITSVTLAVVYVAKKFLRKTLKIH